MIGAMSKRGQETTSNDGSPAVKARPVNLVMRSQYKEETSSPAWYFEIGSRKFSLESTREASSSRQETGAERSNPNKEENPPGTRKLAACSPKFRNIEYTNHRYMGKIFRNLEKKLGMSAINATCSMDANKTNVLRWRLFLASSINAAIHLGPDFLMNLEIYKNTKFENFWSVFNITRKLIKEHSEDILNVDCLEYSSPSWTRLEMATDQAVKCSKAKVCVYADSVLCVGQVKDILGATEKWEGQVEDLKMYLSYQDAVGLDGEAIGCEWTNFPRIFFCIYSSRDPDHPHVNVQRHCMEKEC